MFDNWFFLSFSRGLAPGIQWNVICKKELKKMLIYKFVFQIYSSKEKFMCEIMV